MCIPLPPPLLLLPEQVLTTLPVQEGKVWGCASSQQSVGECVGSGSRKGGDTQNKEGRAGTGAGVWGWQAQVGGKGMKKAGR